MYNIQMKSDAPLRYGFHALPVPAGHVNAFPVAIPAPGIVVGSVSKLMHHCLYQDDVVIWRNYQPHLVEWPKVAPSRFVANFCPASLMVHASAARKVSSGSPSGYIAGSILLALRSEDDYGAGNFGVLWDLNGAVVRTVNLPRSVLQDVNEVGDAVGRSTDWVDRQRGILVSPTLRPTYLEHLLKVKNSWVINDALRINPTGEILALGHPRTRHSNQIWVVLIPTPDGYDPIPAMEWLVRNYAERNEVTALLSLNKIELYRSGGKIGLYLAETERELVAIREVRPVRLTFKARPGNRTCRRGRKRPRLMFEAKPVGRFEPLDVYFPVVRGASDEALTLACFTQWGRIGIQSVLFSPDSGKEIFRPRQLCSDLPAGVRTNDPLIIGAQGELGGQCHIEGVINGYVMERLD